MALDSCSNSGSSLGTGHIGTNRDTVSPNGGCLLDARDGVACPASTERLRRAPDALTQTSLALNRDGYVYGDNADSIWRENFRVNKATFGVLVAKLHHDVKHSPAFEHVTRSHARRRRGERIRGVVPGARHCVHMTRNQARVERAWLVDAPRRLVGPDSGSVESVVAESVISDEKSSAS